LRAASALMGCRPIDELNGPGSHPGLFFHSIRSFPAATHNNGPWVQVSRMANPLVNELIINTPAKDAWNAAEPENEAQFQAFYTNPVIATALELVYGVPVVPINGSPKSNRTDLMSILLKYPGQALAGSNCNIPCAELLRLDLRVPPTAPENQSRLGAALSATPRAGQTVGVRMMTSPTLRYAWSAGRTTSRTRPEMASTSWPAPRALWESISRRTVSPRISHSCPRRTTARTADTSIAMKPGQAPILADR